MQAVTHWGRFFGEGGVDPLAQAGLRPLGWGSGVCTAASLAPQPIEAGQAALTGLKSV